MTDRPPIPDLSDFSGYRPDLERRDALASEAEDWHAYLPAFASYSEPEEIDPRPWMRIENQGNMGSCQGHALSSVCELCYWVGSGGTVIQFSPMWCYLESQRFDNLLGRDHGSTIEAGVRVAKELGVCRLQSFPYPDPVRYHTTIPPGAADDAENFKIRKTYKMTSYDDVKRFLALGIGGVEIGIMWGSSMDRGPVIEEFRAGSGGHAVAYLGYTKRKDSQGRNYLLLANSWSERWGNRGWCEVAPRAVDQQIRSRWAVFVGMSDMDTPEPRRPHYEFW